MITLFSFIYLLFEVRAVGCWPKSLTTLALFIWENVVQILKTRNLNKATFEKFC